MDKKLQVIVLIFSILGSIWAGSWALKDKIVFADDLKMVQKENAMTMQMLQQEIQASRFQSDIRFFETQLSILKDRAYTLRSYLRTNQKDSVAKKDYNDVTREISNLQEKLGNLKLKDK